MIYTILVVVQVVVAISLVGLILIQHGKGADAGAAFGSGASGTVFGSQGSANFLSRSTAALATVFFVISLSLAYLVGGVRTQQAPDSVTEQLQAPGTELLEQDQPSASAPAVPGDDSDERAETPSPDRVPE